MTENISEKLDNVSRVLEKQNEIIQGMLDIMKKPKNKFVEGVVLFGLFVGALVIVNIIDTISRWFFGG